METGAPSPLHPKEGTVSFLLSRAREICKVHLQLLKASFLLLFSLAETKQESHPDVEGQLLASFTPRLCLCSCLRLSPDLLPCWRRTSLLLWHRFSSSKTQRHESLAHPHGRLLVMLFGLSLRSSWVSRTESFQGFLSGPFSPLKLSHLLFRETISNPLLNRPFFDEFLEASLKTQVLWRRISPFPQQAPRWQWDTLPLSQHALLCLGTLAICLIILSFPKFLQKLW